jgi:hypothetical protein
MKKILASLLSLCVVASANADCVDDFTGLGVDSALASRICINPYTSTTYKFGTGATPVFTVTARTSDGADGGSLLMSGGGAYDLARGAGLLLAGNEFNGSAVLRAGDASSADIRLQLENAGSEVIVEDYTTGQLWTFSNGGTLANNSTNGGPILFNKALSGVGNNIGTLAGAGTTQADAAAVVTTVARVTGANGTVGVNLPSLASVSTGQTVKVINSDVTNALKVYSAAVGELISGQAGTTAISLAAKLVLSCTKYDATNWYCEKSVTPY